ncbi:hypothetical protein REPUB_Repub20aG0121200 [Reevesia pubescens]
MYASHTQAGLGCLLGSGDRINFWSDDWVEYGTLKSRFPRIFALAIKKVGKVNEFGVWNEGSWSWNIQLRRRLFDWEMDQWNDFQLVLADYAINLKTNDTLVWKFSPNGAYIVGSFCKSVTNVAMSKSVH